MERVAAYGARAAVEGAPKPRVSMGANERCARRARLTIRVEGAGAFSGTRLPRDTGRIEVDAFSRQPRPHWSPGGDVFREAPARERDAHRPFRPALVPRGFAGTFLSIARSGQQPEHASTVRCVSEHLFRLDVALRRARRHAQTAPGTSKLQTRFVVPFSSTHGARTEPGGWPTPRRLASTARYGQSAETSGWPPAWSHARARLNDDTAPGADRYCEKCAASYASSRAAGIARSTGAASAESSRR